MNLNLGYTDVLIIKGKKAGLSLQEMAYVLATAYHETAHTMKPVVEAFWLSEAWRKKNLRYYPWHGRGFVQLTWEKNYIRAAKELNIPALATDPSLALNPGIAAEILIKGMQKGWFTGKDMDDFIDTVDEIDSEELKEYKAARKVVNGIDKALEIGKLALQYEKGLKAAGYTLDASEKPVQPIPDNPGIVLPEERKDSVEHSPGYSEPATSFIENLLKLFQTLFGGKK
jgi:putative chitinase